MRYVTQEFRGILLFLSLLSTRLDHVRVLCPVPNSAAVRDPQHFFLPSVRMEELKILSDTYTAEKVEVHRLIR